MRQDDSHLSDQQLLLSVDGELSARDEKLVRAHLDGCWKCRTRRQELESAIGDSVRFYLREYDPQVPPAAGPRSLLRARIALIADRRQGFWQRLGWPFPAAIAALLVLGWVVGTSRTVRPMRHPLVVSIPDSRLTPGAALLVNRGAVCEQVNIKNKAVPPALQRAVFEEYGIAGADPRAYEVDYLVTPALGGSDDIHNLWPHSHSATVWNAEVKDALEDRLREMVCEGTLDLADAQREIATNWIAAYKKYFHTDEPLAGHR